MVGDLEGDLVSGRLDLVAGLELFLPGLDPGLVGGLLGETLLLVERDRLVGDHLAVAVDVLADVLEVLVLGHAGGGALGEFAEQRLHAVEFVELGTRDDVPCERVLERRLADLGVAVDAGQGDVGGHALELRAAAAGAVELADGDLHGTGVLGPFQVLVQLLDGLDGALAVGR